MKLDEIQIEEEIVKVPNPITGEDEEWAERTATRSFVSKARITPEAKKAPEIYDITDRRLREAIIRELLKDALQYMGDNGRDYDFISVNGSVNSVEGLVYQTPLIKNTLIILHPEKLASLALIHPLQERRIK